MLHSYEVTEIGLLHEDNSPEMEPTASSHQGRITHGTANLLKDVEKSYEPGVKLLESCRIQDPATMKGAIVRLSEKLNSPVRVTTDERELQAVTEDGKPRYSGRERRAKGWWSSRKGEVVVVLPNNADVVDVENTVVHELIGHKGLRAFIGEGRFGEFLREVYDHATVSIRKKIDAITDLMVNNEADRLWGRKRKAREKERRTEGGDAA